MSSIPADGSLGSRDPQTLVYSPLLPAGVKFAIVIVATLVTSMEFLTSYAVGVALPDIQGDLSASFDEGSWILTVYSVAFLLGLITSNWMAENIGFRQHLANAVWIFMVASAGCGLSRNLQEMLLCRAVMGYAGGTFLVRAQTGMNLTHVGKDRARATLLFAFFVVGGARTFAPAIGGWISEWYSWRYLFFLNIPLGLAALALMFAYSPNLKPTRGRSRLDVVGLLLLAGFIVPVQIVLSRGERDDWLNDLMIVTCVMVAVVCLPLFIWWSCRSNNPGPLINLRLYRNRNFAIGSVYVIILGMMLYGQTYVVPQFLRGIQHYSDSATGYMQTLNGAGFFAGLLLGSLLMQRVGIKVSLALGAVAFTAGMALWATRLTTAISPAAMLSPLLLTGLGAGWQVGPLSALINSQTPPDALGEGTELYLFQRQLGGSWGIAILAILVDARRSLWSSRLGEEFNAFSLTAQDSLRTGANALHYAGLPRGDAAGAAVGIVHGQVLIQSTVNAFVDTYWYQVALGLLALGMILLFAEARLLVSALRRVVTMVR